MTQETIRIVCPHCGSKINAKRKLLGEIRPCPKCKEPLHILLPENVEALPSMPLDEPDNPERPHLPGNKQGVLSGRPLERLNRHSRYVICNRSMMVACWSNDGHGWRWKTNVGLVSANRYKDQLPSHGEFVLTEVNLRENGPELQLTGVRCLQIASHWGLNYLADGDDAICTRITGFCGLNREQKFAVRKTLLEFYMPELLEKAPKIADFLSNDDYRVSEIVQETP